jgi:hypothetical protein
LTASKGESSAVLFELKRSRDELSFVRDESSASDVQSSTARGRLTFALFRPKNSRYRFIASDGEFTAVLGRIIASGDELEESSGRWNESRDEFIASLFRITFVRDRLFASSYRIIVVLFRSVANSARSSASTRRRSDDGRRSVASRGGRTTSDAGPVASGAGLSFARPHTYLVICPYCPSRGRGKTGTCRLDGPQKIT